MVPCVRSRQESPLCTPFQAVAAVAVCAGLKGLRDAVLQAVLCRGA